MRKTTTKVGTSNCRNQQSTNSTTLACCTDFVKQIQCRDSIGDDQDQDSHCNSSARSSDAPHTHEDLSMLSPIPATTARGSQVPETDESEDVTSTPLSVPTKRRRVSLTGSSAAATDISDNEDEQSCNVSSFIDRLVSTHPTYVPSLKRSKQQ